MGWARATTARAPAREASRPSEPAARGHSENGPVGELEDAIRRSPDQQVRKGAAPLHTDHDPIALRALGDLDQRRHGWTVDDTRVHLHASREARRRPFLERFLIERALAAAGELTPALEPAFPLSRIRVDQNQTAACAEVAREADGSVRASCDAREKSTPTKRRRGGSASQGPGARPAQDRVRCARPAHHAPEKDVGRRACPRRPTTASVGRRPCDSGIERDAAPGSSRVSTRAPACGARSPQF